MGTGGAFQAALPEPQISQITLIDLKPTILEFVSGMKSISKISGIRVIRVICG